MVLAKRSRIFATWYFRPCLPRRKSQSRFGQQQPSFAREQSQVRIPTSSPLHLLHLFIPLPFTSFASSPSSSSDFTRLVSEDREVPEEKPLLPYKAGNRIQFNRYFAQSRGTSYVYDIPAVFGKAITRQWRQKGKTG